MHAGEFVGNLSFAAAIEPEQKCSVLIKIKRVNSHQLHTNRTLLCFYSFVRCHPASTCCRENVTFTTRSFQLEFSSESTMLEAKVRNGIHVLWARGGWRKGFKHRSLAHGVGSETQPEMDVFLLPWKLTQKSLKSTAYFPARLNMYAW